MRYFVWCFCILLILLGSANMAAAAGYDFLYYENFEDQSAEGWVPKTYGNWRVQSREDDFAYHQWNTNISASNPYLNEWSIYDREIFGNMTYSARIRTAEHLDSNPHADLGLLFHYQNNNNFYYVSFSSQENATVLILRKNGQDNVLARCENPIVTEAAYFTVGITVLNGVITVSAANQNLFQFYDDTFTDGKIGVGVVDDAAYFDNIVVCLEEETDCSFYENFNKNNLVGWTAYDRSHWHTSFRDYTYVLYLSGEYQPPKPDFLGEIITLDNVDAENFTLEFDLKSIGWGDNEDLAVVWHYKDPQNYYYAVFHRQTGQTEWIRVQDGWAKFLDSYNGPTLSDLEWHHVKVEVKSKYHKIYFDDVMVLDGYEPSLTGGKIGFGSFNDSGWFDNVCLTCDGCIHESLTLTSPNGGEVLTAGDTHRISWLSYNVSNNVMLEYSTDGGQTWTIITSSTPNDSQYDWSVPAVNSNNCKVRIKDIDNSPVDVSDNVFTIQGSSPCSIQLTAPNGGEQLIAGQAQDITWSSSGACGDVKIELLCDDAWSTISAATSNDKYFYWSIPSTLECTAAKIKITCLSNPACSDMSDAFFSIVSEGPQEPIVVTAPLCNVLWRTGEQHKISWIPSGTAVKLEYTSNGGQTWNLIADDVPDIGCYDWTIPQVTAAPTTIKVSDANNPSRFGQSAGFMINKSGGAYLQVSDISGQSGSVTADIFLNGNVNPFDAFGLTLNYDPQHLTLSSVDKGKLTENWIQVTGQENSSGVITIGGFHTTPLPAASDGSIARVTFNVTCTTCDECTQSHLTLSNLTDDAVGFNRHCGTFSWGMPCVLGDVNTDDNITPGDALCAYNIFLNNQVPQGECDTPCAMISADANCDGTVTPGDALTIYNAYLSGQPLVCPTLLAKSSSARSLIIPDVTAQPGQKVAIPIKLDNPAELSSFGLELEFPADVLSFTGVQRTPLTEEWVELRANEITAGRLLMGGYHTQPIVSRSQTDLVILHFNVQKGNIGNALIDIKQSFDDLEFADIQAGQLTVSQADVITEYRLEQNYPNPFNMNTQITFAVPEPSLVQLEVFNITGKSIRTLTNRHYETGKYHITWNGQDEQGLPVTSGLYLYKMTAGDRTFVKKLMLLK